MTEEHRLTVHRSARYYTIGATRSPGEVWVVLHGYGQLAAMFLEKFRALDDGRRLFVAPEALSRFYVSERPSERRVGASWMTREDRLAEIDDYLRYLDATLDDVCRSIGERSVNILGYSQGAATAARWAALGNVRVDRLVLWGGEFPPDLDVGREPGRARLDAMDLTLVYGRSDELITPKVIDRMREQLRPHGLSFDEVPFDGGHELNEDVLHRLMA